MKRLLLAAALLVGCTQTTPPQPKMDMACPPLVCAAENVEDCSSCFEKIGSCCYADHEWGGPPGTFDALVAKCKDSPACVACCNECAALSCDAMKARQVCPNNLPAGLNP